MPKTYDYKYAYRGTWDSEPRGRCRVRILEEVGQVPVLVITELNSNAASSITNMFEVLAAELIAKHFPARFEVIGEDPVILIEHYEPRRDTRRSAQGKPSYDRVTFESWVPHRVREGGQDRLALGEPDWRRMADVEVVRHLGAEADDLPNCSWRRGRD